jgi:hypothetical protein
MERELLSRLPNSEDAFTERKSEGANSREFRKTIVAFANSVPEGKTAVLYIGVSDNGNIQGVANPDSIQKTIRNICQQDCYPPILFHSTVLTMENKSVVAVEISFGNNRPHFSGPAYIRQGSESVNASEEIFNELITSRLSKPAEILKWKGKLVTVIAQGKRLGDTKHLGDSRYRTSHECSIEGCTPHYVQFVDIGSGRHLTEPLENISISFDETKYRLMLIASEK